jgi:hypothetical protein
MSPQEKKRYYDDNDPRLCRCGHRGTDHLLGGAVPTVCMTCSCGQYLPVAGRWRTDPENCADCARIEQQPCPEHRVDPREATAR